MFIAQDLRKKSTAEFVLYMWQVEDIIRAYGCQLSRLKNEYIARFTDYTDEQQSLSIPRNVEISLMACSVLGVMVLPCRRSIIVP